MKHMDKVVDYNEQKKSWPQQGMHILGSYDESDGSIVVYQAFNAAIADYAVENQTFGGTGFSTERMTWIKPNFLWMMYRCGWATKDKNQERVLAITISLACFEALLESSWISSFEASAYTSREEWKAAKATSGVVCQWDPDHDPHGNKENRRAIQLGIRPSSVASVYLPGIRFIEDITAFVEEQHQHLQQCGVEGLMVPIERPYQPSMAVHTMLQLDTKSRIEEGGASEQAEEHARIRQIVTDGYNSIAEEYLSAAKQDAGGTRMLYVNKILSRLAPGAHCLELGCGPGVPVASALCDGGCRVTGVDLSPHQIELARKHVQSPNAEFVCADMNPDTAELDFPPDTFDAVFAFYSIFHLPRETHGRLFQRIHSWLKPGGVFVFNGEPEADQFSETDDFLGAAMVWSDWGPEENKRMLEQTGMSVEEVTMHTLDEGNAVDKIGQSFCFVVASAASPE
jgi:SAM-dependent methyltransferase